MRIARALRNERLHSLKKKGSFWLIYEIKIRRIGKIKSYDTIGEIDLATSNGVYEDRESFFLQGATEITLCNAT
jgi:hypothetical protein